MAAVLAACSTGTGDGNRQHGGASGLTVDVPEGFVFASAGARGRTSLPADRLGEPVPFTTVIPDHPRGVATVAAVPLFSGTPDRAFAETTVNHCCFANRDESRPRRFEIDGRPAVHSPANPVEGGWPFDEVVVLVSPDLALRARGVGWTADDLTELLSATEAPVRAPATPTVLTAPVVADEGKVPRTASAEKDLIVAAEATVVATSPRAAAVAVWERGSTELIVQAIPIRSGSSTAMSGYPLEAREYETAGVGQVREHGPALRSGVIVRTTPGECFETCEPVQLVVTESGPDLLVVKAIGPDALDLDLDRVAYSVRRG